VHKTSRDYANTSEFEQREGGDYQCQQVKSAQGRTSNSKVILAKQFFETMNHNGSQAALIPENQLGPGSMNDYPLEQTISE